MPHDPAIVARIRKLIALAVSSPYEGEQRTAAIEAARLIDKHKIPVGESEVHRAAISTRAREQRAAYRAPDVPVTDWQPSTATAPGRCAVCGGSYRRGDLVWIADRGIIHIAWPDPPCRGW